MHLNDDLAIPVTVRSAALAWSPSPTAGIERRMLFRIGDEKARATSIVRYAPGSHFPYHQHPGGEELLVLDGVFQDESGDYPAGTYIRNPPGTGHAPGSDGGCTIFVRLWQFRADDRKILVQMPCEGMPMPPRVNATGVILHDDGHEQVRIETWSANADIDIANCDGIELLVLEGGFDKDGAHERHCWMRLPAGHDLRVRSGASGASVWLKAGALLHGDVAAF